MLIDLSKLLSVEHKKQCFSAPVDMEYFECPVGKYKFADKESVNLCIENTGKRKLQIDASVRLSLYIPCDRCLQDVKNDFDIEISGSINMGESLSGTEDRDEFSFIEDSMLDTDKMIYNEILVNLPMKVLCREDCKGLCNRCGANLNTQTCDCDKTELDPEMSKILDVFNNFKEV